MTKQNVTKELRFNAIDRDPASIRKVVSQAVNALIGVRNAKTTRQVEDAETYVAKCMEKLHQQVNRFSQDAESLILGYGQTVAQKEEDQARERAEARATKGMTNGDRSLLHKWGYIGLNADVPTLSTSELKAALVKIKAEAAAAKAQVKGLSKSDLALAKKSGLLGRSGNGAAPFTNEELKAELAKVKSEPKKLKVPAKLEKAQTKVEAARTELLKVQAKIAAKAEQKKQLEERSGMPIPTKAALARNTKATKKLKAEEASLKAAPKKVAKSKKAKDVIKSPVAAFPFPSGPDAGTGSAASTQA